MVRLFIACRRRKGVRDVVIMRASQLDAGRLDNELTSMLREQFMSIFSLFQPVYHLVTLLLHSFKEPQRACSTGTST